MEYLTVKQVADLKGCSERYIKRKCKDGTIVSEIQPHPQNKQPCYMIPMSALPEELQAKYYTGIKKESGIKETAPEKKKYKKTHASREFEELSEQERTELSFWCKLLDEWKIRRGEFKNKTEFDKNFIGECKLKYPEIQISTGTLYRKYSAYLEHDYDGIIGFRGGHNKGNNAIPEPVWNAFLWYWLDENKPTASLCYRSVISWTEEFYPELVSEIPSERTFRRHVESDISESLKIYMRDGDKAFSDRCMPYVMRLYDELQANDCWIADNHTFDIQSFDDENKVHRLYLTAFLDAKSGVLVGWNITESPDSQSTILALRHGIMRFGIPKTIYVDNGREFLTHDIGGKGHRTRKNDDDEIIPPTILQRLGIEMRNAIVRNAKAKPIERTFCTLKNQFSRLFSGFCGGTILERPESLKRRIKNGNLPRDYEIREILENWIDGDYNLQNYGGSESQFKNLSRLDVWNKTCTEIRKTTESMLNLMLMRSTRKQKIKRNGVQITICGEQIWYMNQIQTIENLGLEVYVRYDPADLRTARIYEANSDKYLFTWELADTLMTDYLSQKKDEISDAESFIRASKKFVREQAKGISEGLSNQQRISLLDMNTRKSVAKKDKEFIVKQPKNIVAVMTDERIESPDFTENQVKTVTINLEKMARNAKLRKG